ncbi:hypothetical protein FE257_002072 [Aspergillus nanangensis]|uniref:Uncharacterized protein n=1 Tax=Aspergillus nanangensis TaxID=2582783 RepID=A0AAD4CTA1_ASPNN|nr:hypothetical protein FE257_002072 [Aspergillus nanangensis]
MEVDALPSPKRPKQTHAKKAGGYWCDQCSRSFERSDHYARHIHYHEDQRHYRCPFCPKAFNRGDLLYRHKQIHSGKAAEPAHSGRASRACCACVQSKAKCMDQKPCQRCLSRGIPCVPSGKEPKHHRASDAQQHSQLPDRVPGPTDQAHGEELDNEPADMPEITSFTPLDESLDVGRPAGEAHTDADMTLVQLSTPADTNFSMEAPTSPYLGGFSFADAFLPPSGTSELDCFDLDLETLQALMPSVPGDIAEVSGIEANAIFHPSPATSRFESFKRSPWLWTPLQFDHAYAGQENLRINEGAVTSLLQTQEHDYPQLRFTPAYVDSGSRDRILFMVHRTSSFTTPLPAFPSESFLDRMVQVYFGWQSVEPTSWIHAASFSATSCSPELLATVIAAGSSSISIPNVYRMGYALQERSRLSLSTSIENDNRRVRELQTIQTYLLWVSMGLWSGFKRNMEVAESFLGPPITMLRRYGCFSRSLYTPAIVPSEGDEHPEVQEAKWRAWVKQESLKRAAIFAMITDLRSSMAYLKPPKSSLTELSCPLPAARDLWLAPSAQTWTETVLRNHPPSSSSPSPAHPTWISISQTPSLLSTLPPTHDKALIALTVMHGFWSQVWAYQDSHRFFRSSSRRTLLWLSCQHEELSSRIKTAAQQLAPHVPDPTQLQLLAEYCLMALIVSPRETQLFAGRLGEEEAATTHSLLRQWMGGAEFRTAAWHAGQVLRLARGAPGKQLREWSAVAVYQAALTLWAYGVVGRGMGMENVEGGMRVFVDGAGEDAEATAFVMLGKGIPGIAVEGDTAGFAPLGDVRAVMEAACGVLRCNFGGGEGDCLLPPLLEGLIDLMGDLGKIDVQSFLLGAM